MSGWNGLKFTCTTAAGTGAIAVVAVVGEKCIELVSELFQPIGQSKLTEKKLRRPIYGYWMTDGNRGEDLVVCPLTENRIEIQCHGSIAAIQAITESLAAKGAQSLSPLEFSSLVYGSEYWADFHWNLSQAKTGQIASRILEQQSIHHSFYNWLQQQIANNDGKVCLSELNGAECWSHFGRKWTEPWVITICGCPNVGKSSLVNQLVGYQRTIVDATAGTTRDAVDVTTAFAGWPVKITDTAGIRETGDAIENAGIELAKQKIAESDLVVLVVDSTAPQSNKIEEQIDRWRPNLVVANKCDLQRLKHQTLDLSVSATTGEGIEALVKAMIHHLIPKSPEPGQMVPFTRKQNEIISALKSLCAAGDWDQAKRMLAELGLGISR